MHRLSILFLGGLCLWAAPGCHTTIPVRGYEPAPVSLGPVKTLSIVEIAGADGARKEIIDRFSDAVSSDGFYQLRDRTGEGLKLISTGTTATFDGGAPEPGEAFVKINVKEWRSRREPVKVKDANGNEQTQYVPTAEVELTFTVAGASGEVLLNEKPYRKSWLGNTEAQAVYLVTEWVVGQFLEEVTPEAKVWDLRIDDEDAGQSAIIEQAQAGKIAEAIAKTRAYLEAHPKQVAAVYNLAVYLDAAGEYAEALAKYEEAISRGAKPWYTQSKLDCEKRRMAMKDLLPSEEPSGDAPAGSPDESVAGAQP